MLKPYKAPGILNIIPHLENGYGTFFPKRNVLNSYLLVQLAIDLGKINTMLLLIKQFEKKSNRNYE